MFSARSWSSTLLQHEPIIALAAFIGVFALIAL
jgi:hypothetical protein